MANGKHYRGNNSAPYQSRSAKSAPQRTSRTTGTSAPKKNDYEDLYSYEEPRGAKRGTRSAPRSKETYMPVKSTAKKKGRFIAPLVAVLCLLAAAGILLYILWDLGFIGMLLSMLQ